MVAPVLEVFANIYNTNKVAITLKGASVSKRQAVHLVFLIDVSGSMEGDRLNSVKKSLEFLLPLLTSNDMVTLIEFGDESEVLAKAIQTDEQGKAKLQMIINKLHTKGCTNMSSAILRVAELYKDEPAFWASPGHKHSVLLLTDGHANRGVSNVDGLLTIVAKLIQDTPALTLSTVGYGSDHNANLLRDMAVSGTGSYNVVNDLEGIATTFGEILGGLTSVVAQNVTIKIPSSFTTMTSYFVKENSVVIGDIYAEQEIIVLGTLSDSTQVFTVSGYDMSTLDQFSFSVSATSIDAPTKTIELAELRYKVAQLLKSPSKEQAESLLTQLRALSYVSDNLVQMMIEDCETVLETLERGRTRQAEVEMAQHSAYLGLGRGLRSMPMRSPSPPHTWGIQGDICGSAAAAGGGSASEGDPQPLLTRRRTAQVNYASSPFSNRTQAQTVTYMRDRVDSSQQTQQNTDMEGVD